MGLRDWLEDRYSGAKQKGAAVLDVASDVAFATDVRQAIFGAQAPTFRDAARDLSQHAVFVRSTAPAASPSAYPPLPLPVYTRAELGLADPVPLIDPYNRNQRDVLVTGVQDAFLAGVAPDLRALADQARVAYPNRPDGTRPAPGPGPAIVTDTWGPGPEAPRLTGALAAPAATAGAAGVVVLVVLALVAFMFFGRRGA